MSIKCETVSISSVSQRLSLQSHMRGGGAGRKRAGGVGGVEKGEGER